MTELTSALALIPAPTLTLMAGKIHVTLIPAPTLTLMAGKIHVTDRGPDPSSNANPYGR